MRLLSARTVPFQRRVLRSLDELPAFSPVVRRLLAGLARERVSCAELAELVEKDTALSAIVLRIVNSAIYGRRAEVTSVPHGIAIIGLDKLRNTILTATLARLWRRGLRARCWSGAAFKLHATAVATLAGLIVRRLPAEYPEGAFAAGLFHDVGKLLIAGAAPEEYETISVLRPESPLELEGFEKAALGVTHAELGFLAAVRWDLPAPVQRAVRRHHRPDDGDGCRVSLSRIVHVADQCVNSMGITVPPVTPQEIPVPAEALEALGVRGSIPALFDEFCVELDMLRAFI